MVVDEVDGTEIDDYDLLLDLCATSPIVLLLLQPGQVWSPSLMRQNSSLTAAAPPAEADVVATAVAPLAEADVVATAAAPQPTEVTSPQSVSTSNTNAISYSTECKWYFLC